MSEAKRRQNVSIKIVSTLASFEKIKEWADMGYWLQKMAKLIEEFKSPELPEKLTFAKRLAQCLNPQLPHGVHLSALEVYRLIFKNMRDANYNWAEDIALFSIGLFPLFQYASFQVKPVILELFREFLFPMCRQLIPCVTGLVISILPGLEEQNEELRNNVMKTLDQACLCIGRRYFIGAIWISILRSPRVRLTGLKYLQKKLQKPGANSTSQTEEQQQQQQDQQQQQQQQQDTQEYKSSTFQSQLNESMGIDKREIINDINEVSGDFIQLEDKDGEQIIDMQIVQEVYERQMQRLQLLEKDINCIDDQTNYPNKSSLVINGLISCLEDENALVKRTCLDFLSSHFKLQFELFNEKEKIILIEACLYLLIKKDISITRRIYTWLFGPPDLENKYNLHDNNEFVLELIISAFKNIFKVIPKSNNFEVTQPLKILQNFYMEHEHLIEKTLKQLALDIIYYIYVYSKDDKYQVDVMKSGERFMENLTNNFGLIFDSLSEVLGNEIQKKNDIKCSEILQLVEFAFEKLLIIQETTDKIRYTNYLKVLISGIFRATGQLVPEDIIKLSFIYPAIQLALKLVSNLSRELEQLDQQSKIYIESLKDINTQFDNAIHIYSNYYTNVASYILTQLYSGIELNSKFQHFFSTSCKLIIKIQMYITSQSSDNLPNWIISLIECIKVDKTQICLPSLEGVMEILLHEQNVLILLNIKKQLISDLRSRNITRKQLAPINNNKVDVIRLVIQKLWSLLDYSYHISKVIDLITKFQNTFTLIFSDMLTTSFTSVNLQEKELAIRRFSTFWKLTGEQYNYSNIYIVEVALFNMLEFLDHDNPLLRLSCKSWLQDSIPELFRILDPMFEVLIKPANLLFITEEKQYFYNKEYDTKRVYDVFKKLKSILITTNEHFIQYITLMPVSDKVKDLKSNFGINDQLLKHDNYTYLEILIVMCLRYIQGQAIESLSTKFYQENSTVNASACEFLELLIRRLEKNKLSIKVTHFIVEPILYLLKHANTNEDYVLQIQLISLIKVILFQSQWTHYENKDKISSILSSKMFIPNFLNGLSLKLPSYLRIQFIDFISTCLPYLIRYLKHPTLAAIVKQILHGYFTLIIKKDEANELEEELEDDERLIEIVEQNEQKLDQQSQSQERKSKNLPAFNLVRRQLVKNETGVLLDCIKQVLQQFVDLSTDKIKMESEEKSTGVFNWIFSTNQTNEQSNYQKEQENQEGKAILKELPSIFKNYLFCWKTSKQLKDFVDFSFEGITPYYFDKFKTFNKTLAEQFQILQKFSQSIKSQILSVLIPLANQHPQDLYNGLLYLWIVQCNGQQIQENLMMAKIVDILISMRISPDTFINSLGTTIIIQNIFNSYEKKKKETTKKLPVLNYELALTESKIFYLIYTYLTYLYTDSNSLSKGYLTNFWNAILKFLKGFLSTKNPNTLLWMLETLYICSIKFNPKEILSNNNIRKDLNDISNILMIQIAQIGAAKHTYTYNEQNPENIQQQQQQQQGKYKIVKPYSPSIYGIYKELKQKVHNKYIQADEIKFEEEYEIEKIMFLEENDTEQSLTNRYRFFCLKTLSKIGLNILQNIYSTEKNDRITTRTKEIMDIVFLIIEKKDKNSQLFLECGSELLYSFLETGRMFLIKELKKPILDIFMGNDFFKCNKRTLKLWSKIIDWVVTMDKGDLFTEMLNKVSSFSFIFSRDSETKQKIKNFERVCFMIFSGEKDQYQGKLRILIEKMSEVIKNTDNQQPGLLILIIFCIRILILRLSPTTSGELFRNIWPMLLTLLIQIFKKKKDSVVNPNLTLAGLKLIELISVVGLEEFYLHQWIFVFDYFGLQLKYYNPKDKDKSSTNNTNSNIIKNNLSPKDTQIISKPNVKLLYHSPFKFQPYITNCIPQEFELNYLNQQFEVQETYSKRQRAIIMTQTFVQDEIEIKNKALALSQYLINTNEFRSEVNPNQIVTLIEGDFITLDDYIFDIN